MNQTNNLRFLPFKYSNNILQNTTWHEYSIALPSLYTGGYFSSMFIQTHLYDFFNFFMMPPKPIFGRQLKRAVGLLGLLIATWASVIGLALGVMALVNYADNIERHTQNDVLFTMLYALLALLIGLLTGKQGRTLLKQAYAQERGLRE